MGFIHLHLHTEYSLLDGATKVNELFEHVKSLGQDAVAITEHRNTVSPFAIAHCQSVRHCSLSVRSPLLTVSPQIFDLLSVGPLCDPWRGV